MSARALPERMPMASLHLTLRAAATAVVLPACSHDIRSTTTSPSSSAEKTITLLHIADTHAQRETHPQYMPGEEPVMGAYPSKTRGVTVSEAVSGRGSPCT